MRVRRKLEDPVYWYVAGMDLTTRFPRSPYDMNAGIVMLPRTTDKAGALQAGKLGDYLYNCPLDEKLFEFTGLDAERFGRLVRECEGDDEVAAAIEQQYRRSPAENDAFNNMMRHLRPQDAEAQERFAQWLKDMGRDDYSTYFEHLDAEEGRF